MDYEKKYKDALERAEKALEVFGTDKCEGARQIFSLFPELKESEDEKIRKGLIDFVKSRIAGFPECKRFTDWLEKQGEQKHFDYENANIQQKDFAPQKDIPRYSIGDVLCDKSCTMLNKESQSNFEITDIRNGMYICDKCSFPISQQDEYELVAKRIEQKPADLEEFINELSKQFPDVSFAKLSRIAVRVAKWAKPTDEEMKELLRTEYEKGRADAIAEMQKPAWSEEDDKWIESLIQTIEDGYLEGFNQLKSYGVISWLKSLKERCAWKPDEWQLKAIKWILDGDNPENWTVTLTNLYNDLKKL